jgi:uncharacterized damage-inducible protein DinB
VNDSQRLAKQLDMALHGEAWHGPAWQELLIDVDAARAERRPLEGAHSIADIVRHVTTWNDVVRRRIEGEMPDVPDEADWPAAKALDKDAWDAAVARFLERGAALRDRIAAFPPERLHENRPSPANGTWQDLILGQLQHVLYHAGQVALLKKSTSSPLRKSST